MLFNKKDKIYFGISILVLFLIVIFLQIWKIFEIYNKLVFEKTKVIDNKKNIWLKSNEKTEIFEKIEKANSLNKTFSLNDIKISNYYQDSLLDYARYYSYYDFYIRNPIKTWVLLSKSNTNNLINSILENTKNKNVKVIYWYNIYNKTFVNKLLSTSDFKLLGSWNVNYFNIYNATILIWKDNNKISFWYDNIAYSGCKLQKFSTWIIINEIPNKLCKIVFVSNFLEWKKKNLKNKFNNLKKYCKWLISWNQRRDDPFLKDFWLDELINIKYINCKKILWLNNLNYVWNLFVINIYKKPMLTNAILKYKNYILENIYFPQYKILMDSERKRIWILLKKQWVKLLTNKEFVLDLNYNIKNATIFKIKKIINKNKIPDINVKDFWLENHVKKEQIKNNTPDIDIKDLENAVKKDKINKFHLYLNNYKFIEQTWLNFTEKNIKLNIKNEWVYLLKITDINWYDYFVKFIARKKVIEDEYNYWVNNNKLLLKLSSPFPLNTWFVYEQVKNFFKSYKTEISFENHNKILNVRYYIVPWTIFTWKIIFKDIFWNELIKEEKISIDKIPSMFKYAWVEWNYSVNILPKNWYWWKHISIWFRNIREFDLYFQKCDLWNNLKISKSTFIWKSLLVCSWKPIHKVYKINNFDYWTKYWIDYELPNEIQNWKYFRVSFYKDFSKANKYFNKTNIWLYAKYTGKENFYVFANTFDNWKSIKNIKYDVYKILHNWKLEKMPINTVNSWYYSILKWDFNWQNSYLIKWSTFDDETFLIYTNWWWHSFKLWNYYNYARNSFYIDNYNIWVNYLWWNVNEVKIFWYTDRWLYRPGDKVFFAWWVRKLFNKNMIPNGKVVVYLKDFNNNSIAKQEITNIDKFGGFNWQFKLSDSANLWLYSVIFVFSDWETYTQNIQVKEFKKSTFYVKWKLIRKNNDIFIDILPKYYFWKKLEDYNIKISYEVKWNLYNKNNRWLEYNTGNYYYNFVFWNEISTWWYIEIKHLKWDLQKKLFSLDWLKDLSFKYTIKVNIILKNNKTDETKVLTEYMDINPAFKVWFSWQAVERIYKSDIKNKIKIKWIVQKIDTNLTYEYVIYKKDNLNNEEKWPDWAYYYVDNEKFKEYKKWKLIINNNKFEFSFSPDLNSYNSYYLIVVKVKNWKNILWQVQKFIYFYNLSSYVSLFWKDKNNYILEVNTSPKEYKLSDYIPINISPYKKWANVIITVEKWNRILDLYNIKLNWQKLQIPVKKSYYPNINISVIEIVWEKYFDLWKRKPEPRFYVWYTQVNLSKDMVKLYINIDTNKKVYKPWENVKLRIKTYDQNNKPVDARLSISVVDKALTDLYDLIKKPIPYFYNKLWTYIINIANFKNLYVSLKNFISEGEKWWWGWKWISILWWIRNKFYDLAFWSWEVYTKNWVADLVFKLPDNTTTWIIDVIGITKNMKLWTSRKEIITQKDLIVQANLPTFMTIWDNIKIPVSFKSNNTIKSAHLSCYEWFKNNWKIDWIKIWEKKVKNNENVYFKIYLNKDKFEYSNIYIKCIANNWENKDIIQKAIPIRKKWFILHKFNFKILSNYENIFKLDNSNNSITYNLSISLMPIKAFSRALNYLLHYPYWCSEQLWSSLYSILLAKNLYNKNIPLWDIIIDNKINLWNKYEWPNYVNIKQIVEDTIEKIFQRQKEDWWISYWSDDSSSSIILSSYIYWVLVMAQKMWYYVNNEKLNKLEKYLDLIWNRPLPYLYYLWVRTNAWKKINFYLFEEIYKKAKTKSWTSIDNLALHVLAYSIYTNLWKKPNIDIDFSLYSWSKIKDLYWTFLNKDILKSIYLRALLKQNKIQLAKSIIIDLLNNRSNRWIWWWWTQKNIQVLIALSNYLEKLNNNKSVHCDAVIEGKKYSFNINNKKTITAKFNNKSLIKSNINCSEKVYIDEKLDYIINNFWSIKNELHNLANVNFYYTWWNNIWDIWTWKWTFLTLKDANQLAVEFYIPSNYQFLKTVSKNNNLYKFPFDINEECKRKLTHYEVRFDKLFLLFGKLEKNTSCSVSIKTIKSFEWNTNKMPTNIFEMYNTTVWWRKR